MEKGKKLILNTFSSFLMQAVTAICGLIIPRLILKSYGSDVNGLLHSIGQFISVISFLELGVGAVIQSALYKPLANNSKTDISRIIKSGSNFFKKIAFILVGYVALLIGIYPFLVSDDFSKKYVVVLILILSFGSFVQYFFGITDILLLNSAQCGYVHYCLNILLTLTSAISSWIFIKYGYSIHIVKLVSATVFVIKPLLIRLYVNKKFELDRKIKFDKEPISQKWNGISQHIAAFILDGTDYIVLTLFSSLGNVSVYSAYYAIVSGMKNLLLSATGGIQAILGEYIAKDDKESARSFFSVVEFSIHSVVICLFLCVGKLIVPFISVYTKGISDVNYIQPAFALLLTCAHGLHCLRLPYNILILAGGHYKQTQSNYIIAAILNIVISVITVKNYGLIGVAIGTLVAMVYQTIWMAIYDSKCLICWPIKNFIKQISVDLLNIALFILASSWIKLCDVTYLAWIKIAIPSFFISFGTVVITSFVFYRNNIIKLIRFFLKKGINL